jgi:SAM-dependent methyltransferase
MAVIQSERLAGVVVSLKRVVGELLTAHSRSDHATAPAALRLRQVLWRRGNRPSPFVVSYLGGLRGIEIGASAHNDYGLHAVNVDRYGEMDTIYKLEELRLSGRQRAVDVVAPGDQLPFEAGSADFVFASHVIEHFPDPIRALEEWLRVARKYVVLVVPHRDRTFDCDRELTPVDELLRRHEQHFEDPADQHWSVWTCESFLELCERLGLRVVDVLDPDDKAGNGFMVVLDATPALPHDAQAASFSGSALGPARNSSEAHPPAR